MPYIIAHEPERSKLAYSLQRRAELDLVGLVSVTSKCRYFQDVRSPLKFSLAYVPESASLNGQSLSTPVQFSFKAVDEKDLEAASFECVFRADYTLHEGYQPTQEEIGAFTESNAIFNCWPYFREMLQNTLSRMNYPPLSIPFLRLAMKPAVTSQPVQAQLEAVKMLEGSANTAQGKPKIRRRYSRKKP